MVLPAYPTRTHTFWNDDKASSDKTKENKTQLLDKTKENKAKLLNKLEAMVNATFSSITDDDYTFVYDANDMQNQQNIMLDIIKQLHE